MVNLKNFIHAVIFFGISFHPLALKSHEECSPLLQESQVAKAPSYLGKMAVLGAAGAGVHYGAEQMLSEEGFRALETLEKAALLGSAPASLREIRTHWPFGASWLPKEYRNLLRSRAVEALDPALTPMPAQRVEKIRQIQSRLAANEPVPFEQLKLAVQVEEVSGLLNLPAHTSLEVRAELAWRLASRGDIEVHHLVSFSHKDIKAHKLVELAKQAGLDLKNDAENLVLLFTPKGASRAPWRSRGLKKSTHKGRHTEKSHKEIIKDLDKEKEKLELAGELTPEKALEALCRVMKLERKRVNNGKDLYS